MKKVLFVLLFSTLGFVTFAGECKIASSAKKNVKTEVVKKVKPYPVTAILSCGLTATWTSSCSGTVAECIPEWNGMIAFLEQTICHGGTTQY